MVTDIRSEIWCPDSYAPKASQYKREIQHRDDTLKLERQSLSGCYKRIEGGSQNQERNIKYIAKASHGKNVESEPYAYDLKTILHSVKKYLVALYKFSYPYAMASLVSFSRSNHRIWCSNINTVNTLLN